MAERGWSEEEVYLLADRGYAFYLQGQYQQAGVIFEALTVIDTSNAYCRNALATVCMALGDAERAISELSILLDQNPANLEARARRCEAYCEQQLWSQATDDLAVLRRNGERLHVKRLASRLQRAEKATRRT
jgi:tetratricopeptide (TPR) repeat protein